MEAPVKWISLCSILFVISSVSAEGVIGAITPSTRSAPVPELCAACVTGCRTISGLFTRPQLPPGYSLVTQVPKGACRLVVSQLKHTRNFIALRNPNGTYILNGIHHDVGRNREVESAGTRFLYRRQDTALPETITASGPLSHSVDIMMVYHQPNPGIKYEYMIPVEQTVEHLAPPLIEKKPHSEPELVPNRPTTHHHHHHHVEPALPLKPLITLSQSDDARPLRRRRRKFVWKITGMTSCSRTCGGGVQYPLIMCVRENNQAVVLERRCTGLEKPRNQTSRCNAQPCSSNWGGQWSACSTTCGPGEQTRVLECVQEVTGSLTMRVRDSDCLEPRPSTTRRCDLAPCEIIDNELEQELPTRGRWLSEPWSQCSVTCGTGQRTRSVSCTGQCHVHDRPPHMEFCHGAPCPSTHVSVPQQPLTSSASTSISWWLSTDWSEHCSEGCGTGTQSRWVTCPTGECDPKVKPDTSRACSSDKQCGGRWFAGPWGTCSESCNETATQKREVICVVYVRGQARIVSDKTCPIHEKPVAEKQCDGSCTPRWFTGEWGTCEGHCPNGVQRREVRCLDFDGRYASGCDEDMPVVKRNCHCSYGLSTKTDYSSRESSQAQDEPSPDRSCTDKFSNCALVVQARMCQYPFYKASCCISCRRNPQDIKE